MNRFLLDTHVVIWLAIDPEQIPAGVRQRLNDADMILVSAASTYELAQKVRLGRLPQAEAILDRWNTLMTAMRATELPLSTAHMARAGSMTWAHRDPFDRMLVAQAQLEGLTLVTRDSIIQSLEAVVCAPWE